VKVSRLLVFGFSLMLLCTLCAPHARASEWNQATKMTFSGPVQIPGKVLTAGTYWFTLLANDSDRNIVQVWNADRMHLLATFLTVPDYRQHPKGRTVVKFEEEQPRGMPEALEVWFYPGDNYGHEFVYPETEARDLAKRVGHPVLSMRDDVASNITKPAKSASDPSVVALKHANVEAVNPQGQDVNMAKAVQTSPQGAKQ
jgi:hypothetical protein